MGRIIKYILKNYFLITIFLVYLLVGGLLIYRFKNVINPDGVAYLSIAKKYALGNYIEAVNAYWSPLLSWLLVPFAWLNLNLQIAAKLISLISGAVIICFTWLLTKERTEKLWLQNSILIAAAILCLFWTLPAAITPDILTVLVVVCYVYAAQKKQGKLNSIILGIIGVVGYYSKSYFLFFFIAHQITLFGIRYYSIPKKEKAIKFKLYKNHLITASIFAVFVLPWVTVLSMKYNKLTFSTSGSYNLAIQNPAKPGHPMHTQGLLPPPNSTAVSAWEDPSYIKLQNWNMLSMSNVRNYIRIVLDNFKRFGQALNEYSIFSLSFILFILVYLFVDESFRKQNLIILSSLVVYSLGYMAVLVDPRYTWPVVLMLLPVAAQFVDVYSIKFPRPTRAIWIVVFISIIYGPLFGIRNEPAEANSIRYKANIYKSYINHTDKVASDSFGTIYYCYYLHAKCFGEIYPNQTKENIIKQINQFDINKFIVIKNNNPETIQTLEELHFTKVPTAITEEILYVRDYTN